MKKYITEFIGTFFLVLTVGLCVLQPGVGSMAPIAIGFVLMVMIYAGGHISGAHYNPAVSVAVLVRGKLSNNELLPYIIAQLIAAGAAAFMVTLFGFSMENAPAKINSTSVILAEFLFTFALSYVVLNVASAKDTSGNSFYGLAIGATVTAGAYAVGGISGAAFNPAVALGASLLGIIEISNLWLYLVSTFAGGVVAALVFNYLNPADR